MTDRVVRLTDLLAVINDFAAFDLAAPWDNVGLLVGEPGMAITGVLVALDPTLDVLDEALRLGINTVLTHHPCIFKPIKSIRTDQPVGRFLARALRHDLAVIGCHTNLDVVAGGVSDALATRLGLVDVEPLEIVAAAAQEGGVGARGLGFGRIGRLAPALAADSFMNRILAVLEARAVWVAGPMPERIERVAVCGGSGSDLAEIAQARGADLYVTAELKHSTARWAEGMGFCMVDAGHFSTENPAVPALVELLRRELAAQGPALKIAAASTQGNPWKLITAWNF